MTIMIFFVCLQKLILLPVTFKSKILSEKLQILFIHGENPEKYKKISKKIYECKKSGILKRKRNLKKLNHIEKQLQYIYNKKNLYYDLS